MRIAVPVENIEEMDSRVSAHFGRAVGFVIYDDETKGLESVSNTSEHMGGKGKPPELIENSDVDLVLCSNLGRRAVDMFNKMGIDVCVGASGTVKDVLKAWNEGKLSQADSNNVCTQHHTR